MNHCSAEINAAARFAVGQLTATELPSREPRRSFLFHRRFFR